MASHNTIKPVNETIFNRSFETQLPMNLEPAIPNPSIHSQIDEWLINEIQLQNHPYKLFPQIPSRTFTKSTNK